MRAEAAVPRAPVDALGPVALVAAGGLLLMLRAQAMTLGAGRVAALVTLYVALGALSLRASVPVARPGSIGVGLTAALGMAAVVVVVLGPRAPGAPVLFGAWAAALSTLAAVAEEAFFRRFVYGWVDRWWGPAAAVLLSAAAFALVHVPLYGAAALWLDLGAGLLLSWQRWASGSWMAPAVTHVWANLLVVIR